MSPPSGRLRDFRGASLRDPYAVFTPHFEAAPGSHEDHEGHEDHEEENDDETQSPQHPRRCRATGPRSGPRHVKASRKTQTVRAGGLCFREAFTWRTPAGSAGRPSRSAQSDVFAFFVFFVIR
jgi:hypothetical protein